MRSVPRTSKSVFACVIATFALLAANRAMGQTTTGGTIGTGAGGTTGSTPLAMSDFTAYFKKYDGKNWIQMNATSEQLYFFNRARCECDKDPRAEVEIVIVPGANTTTKISNNLTNNITASTGGAGRLYAGNSSINCLSPSSYNYGLDGSCTNLYVPDPSGSPSAAGYATSFQMTVFETSNSFVSNPIPVAWLYNSFANPTCGLNSTCDLTSMCSTVSTTLPILFWAQTVNSTNPDFQDNTALLSAAVVGVAPYAPAEVMVEGGNEALNVSWTWPDGQKPSTSSSFWGVQIFCHRADSQVYPDGWYSPAYMTAKMLCGDAAPAASSYGGTFSDLDPKYLCSGLLPPTTTSYRVEGLQNGITYAVGVASIDKFGNISTISPADVQYTQPIPTVDFYSEYRDVGGTAQGGFCNLASQHARPGMATILCLVGLGLVLRLRKQSKRRPPSAGAFVVLIAAGILTAGQAHATGAYLGPTILEEEPEEPWHGSPREYAIEMRFGLYRPNIDSEFSGNGDKPQAYIFGNKRRPMWQMELDWEFLQEFGTLSLGGVIGYYKENARACTQAGLDATPPSCVRSGDNTGLRLIPLAALLVYRMDEAAQRWGIPLVPYAKIGLNYTIWTVTNGDGNVASAPSGGRGQGGTMGWQASVGLSLQLDFIDASAARGFDADTGVNHTYAFFELDHIDSSGLYRKDVLRVGDDTWFAGLMFEF
jgi:hypothetical protein